MYVIPFLSWTLPENLNPDGGISYKRSESAIKYNHPGPVGTNFLDQRIRGRAPFPSMIVVFRKERTRCTL